MGTITVLQNRTDNDFVATDGDRTAEPSRGIGIAGGQFGLLAPTCPTAHKDIGGTTKNATSIIQRCADDGRIPTDRHRRAKRLLHDGITGRQFGLLRPICATAHKDIGGAAIHAIIIIPIGPHHGRLPTDGNREAKQVTFGGIIGG